LKDAGPDDFFFYHSGQGIVFLSNLATENKTNA
jgi:hypothetical protein